MRKITLVAALLFSITSVKAQVAGTDWCGSVKAWNNFVEKNPSYYKSPETIEKNLQERLTAMQKNGQPIKPAGTVIYIPIVFHILHQNGPENISDAQVYDAIKCINEDFRKLNSDASNTVPAFQGIAADCEIEVRIATIDPSGNCTKGIEHIYSQYTVHSDQDPSNLSLPNQWDPTRYLNVWVVSKITSPSTAAGYSHLPNTVSPDREGIVMLSAYVGSIGTGSLQVKHTLPHEVGHFCGLYHTWGNTNSPEVACGDDYVNDTPLTMGHSPGNCNLTDQHCTAGVTENIQNFMEYAYCPTMFTQGQKTRMLQQMAAYRYTIYSSSNLVSTGATTAPVLCAADFGVSTDTVCSGNSVTFSDLSYNGVPTSWSWTFSGGTPSTSTLASPTVLYNTAGVYNVSLTIGNSTGNKTATKNGFMLVRSVKGVQYSQNFEGFNFPGTDFSVVNRDNGITWQKTTSAGSSGTSSVYINNGSNPAGQVDDLIGPGVNLSVMGSPEFSFKVAYTQQNTSSTDKLQVYLSTDCGVSWAQRYAKSGSSLSTAPATTSTFTPTSAQWRKEVVTLGSAFTGKTNVMFMFRFTNGGGNNIYIDDINLVDLTGIKEDEFGSKLGLNIYPNPVENNSVIAFKLSDPKNVSIKLYDILGRDIATVVSRDLAAGEHSFPVAAEASGLKRGIYFVKLVLDNEKSYTQKMVIQ